MGKKDARIDAYIAKSEDFAKPILNHFRDLVHQGCPDVEEAMKWSFPHFLYQGMLCSMASFKQHCAIGFWKQQLVLGESGKADAMGQFGRITSLKDLPSDKKMLQYIKKAVQLNEEGVKIERPKRNPPKAIKMPEDLQVSLKKNKKASVAFEKFSPSDKREYIEWITDAKTDATRQRRLATAMEWISEGKGRNWKYER